jgi:hypothetical protein
LSSDDEEDDFDLSETLKAGDNIYNENDDDSSKREQTLTGEEAFY